MTSIINRMLAKKQLKKSGMETYGKTETKPKHTLKSDINKVSGMLKNYAAGADDRRKAKIAKGKEHLAMEKQKTALLREKQKQSKLRGNAPSLTMGLGPAPTGKKKKKQPSFQIGF